MRAASATASGLHKKTSWLLSHLSSQVGFTSFFPSSRITKGLYWHFTDISYFKNKVEAALVRLEPFLEPCMIRFFSLNFSRIHMNPQWLFQAFSPTKMLLLLWLCPTRGLLLPLPWDNLVLAKITHRKAQPHRTAPTNRVRWTSFGEERPNNGF